jgi:hypothetical protein
MIGPEELLDEYVWDGMASKQINGVSINNGTYPRNLDNKSGVLKNQGLYVVLTYNTR